MNVTCNKCGWVHFQVSREFAESEVKKFNEFFDTLTKDQKRHYGGPCTLAEYDQCDLCGGSYKNFRDSVKGDCPDGCTIGPIISREE